jgi:hypothetical protein
VVDDEVRRDERVHLGRVAPEVGHRVAHHREVDDGRDAGEVLEDDPRRHERHLGLGGDTWSPRGERLDLIRTDDAATGVAEDVLDEDLQRDRRAPEVQTIPDGRQTEVVRQARTEAGAGAEGVGSAIWVGHAFSVTAVGTLVAWKSTAGGRRPGPVADEGLGRRQARRRSRPRRRGRQRCVGPG